MLPERIAHYEVKHSLGRGGMAEVFLGYDGHYRRDVAIKVMLRQHLEDESLRVRFNREAKTVKDLEHPTIVPLFDYLEFGPESLPVLIMAYMPRGSLKDRLKGQPLPVDVVTRTMQRIGLALDYAHSQNVVHRDIKPANILYNEHDHPFLADFGIALSLEEAMRRLGRPSTAIVGTPHYMAPEQALAGQVTAQSDIYALGIVMFEMLTGKRPYETDTPQTAQDVINRHLKQPIPNILEFNPRLPAGYRWVIQQAMAKEPADRYATAREMVDAMRAVSRGDSGPPAPGPGRPPAAGETMVDGPALSQQADESEAPPPRRAGPLVALGLLGLMALVFVCTVSVAGGGFMFRQEIAAMLGVGSATPATVTRGATAPPTGGGTPDPAGTPEPGDPEDSMPATLAVRRTRSARETAAASPSPAPLLEPTLITPTPGPIRSTPLPPTQPAERFSLLAYTSCDPGSMSSFARNATILIGFEWDGQLGPGEYLEVRIGPVGAADLSNIGGAIAPEIRVGNRFQWPIAMEDVVKKFPENPFRDYHWEIGHMSPDQRPITLSARGCLRVTP